jgi:hypothetical protein
VREAYEQRWSQFGLGEDRWEWPQAVLEEFLGCVTLASASRQVVSILVDALDETGAESAQHFAAYFHRLIDRVEKRMLLFESVIYIRILSILYPYRET